MNTFPLAPPLPFHFFLSFFLSLRSAFWNSANETSLNLTGDLVLNCKGGRAFRRQELPACLRLQRVAAPLSAGRASTSAKM